jgi:hypothetical protein
MNDRAENSPVRQVSKSALTEYRKLLGQMIEEVVEGVFEDSTQVEQGRDQLDLLPAGFEFTLKMLDGAASVGDLALLEDQLQWAVQHLPHQGILAEQLLTRFQLLETIMEEVLSAGTWAEFRPYLHWMITRQQELVEEAQSRNPE